MSRPARLLVLAAGIGLISQPAFAQLTANPDDSISLWRVGGALILCLALAIVAAFLLRSRGVGELAFAPTRRTRRLRLQESLRVSPQVQLALVLCDDREMLISTSSSGAQLISLLPASDK